MSKGINKSTEIYTLKIFISLLHNRKKSEGLRKQYKKN